MVLACDVLLDSDAAIKLLSLSGTTRKPGECVDPWQALLLALQIAQVPSFARMNFFVYLFAHVFSQATNATELSERLWGWAGQTTSTSITVPLTLKEVIKERSVVFIELVDRDYHYPHFLNVRSVPRLQAWLNQHTTS